MIEKYNNNKDFYKKLLVIAIPIALQNFITSSLNMIDLFMIGKLGDEFVAAIGLANRIFFLLILLLFGISSGSAVFTAQYWGKKDVKNIRRVLGICLISSLICSIIFAIIALFFPAYAMKMFTNERDIIYIGKDYLTIIGLSYPITAITFAYLFVLRSTGEAIIPSITSASAVVINTVLNYILIYGKFGIPELGVKGAALATLLARTFECMTLIVIVYKRDLAAAARLHEMIDISKEFFDRYIKTVLPVVFNEGFWALGVTMYAIAYGKMGKSVLAAITLTQAVEQLALVFFQGLSSATGVILGNEIGANLVNEAYVHAKKLLRLGIILSILVSINLIIFNNLVIGFFDVSLQVLNYAKACLIVLAVYLPFKVFNFINIVGVLRSGGDTIFTFLLDSAGVWLIGTPAAFIGALVLKLPIYYVYALVMTEEVVKMKIGLHR